MQHPTLLVIVVEHWLTANCGLVLIFQIIVHPEDQSWQNSNRNLEAESWAGLWKNECSLLSYSGVHSACLFIQTRTTCMGWYHPQSAGPSHIISLIKKILTQAYFLDSLMEEAFPQLKVSLLRLVQLVSSWQNLNKHNWPIVNLTMNMSRLNNNFSCFHNFVLISQYNT